ncbi:MAG: MFS transporter [Thermomicrobiales bacterium]
MNDGPAETGTPGEPGGTLPPARMPLREGSPVANVWHPAQGDEAAALPDAPPLATPVAPGIPDIALNGYVPAPPSYAVVPESRPIPPDDIHASSPLSPDAAQWALAVLSPPRAHDLFGDFWDGIQAWFRPRPVLGAADLRRNLPLGVAIAALNGFADALLLPAVVVAAFVARVSDSNILVALVPVVAALAWGLPGAILGSAIANRTRLITMAVTSATLRALTMGLLALVGAGRAGGTAKGLLVTFFVLYGMVGCASGFAMLVGQRLPGRIATNGVRGRLVRWQALAATGASVLAALLVRRVLVYGPVFPREYLYLFFIAFIALLGVALLTVALTERGNRIPVVPRPSFAGLRAGPGLLRLSAYRRYLAFRIIALVATIAEPFFVVYTLRAFNVSADMIGIYVIAVIATRAATMYLWRGLARITGTKLLLQLSALCRALAAFIAIGLPVLFETEPVASHFTTDLSRARVFIAVFVCIGAAMGANAVAQSGFLLDILPPNAYADGVGFTNGVLALCSVSLIAGGMIVDRNGFRALFITALVLGLLTVLVGGILREPRRPLRRSGALGPGIRRTEAFPIIPPYHP